MLKPSIKSFILEELRQSKSIILADYDRPYQVRRVIMALTEKGFVFYCIDIHGNRLTTNKSNGSRKIVSYHIEKYIEITLPAKIPIKVFALNFIEQLNTGNPVYLKDHHITLVHLRSYLTNYRKDLITRDIARIEPIKQNHHVIGYQQIPFAKKQLAGEV